MVDMGTFDLVQGQVSDVLVETVDGVSFRCHGGGALDVLGQFVVF